MSREKDLTKNTIIITIGRISTQFVSFLLLPLYTALLSTSEYGTVDLITTLVQLFIPISSLMIDQGVFRYLLTCNSNKDKKQTITSAVIVLLVASALVIIVYGVLSIFSQNRYKIWLLLILIVTAFSNLFLQMARGLKQTKDYALASFGCSASTIVLNVICIVSLHMGATGMLLATFVGNLICCVFLFFKLRIGKFINIGSFSKKSAIEQLKYSIPLVPNQLSLWVMNSSDRLIVASFLGASANGILAVSHKFPAIYMTFFNIFQLAWHETGAIHYFDKDRDEFFTNIIKKMLSIFSTLCLAIIVVLPIVFSWFINSSYNEAYNNIPIYMVAFLFNIVIGLLGVVYVATKKTAEIAKTTVIAAVINIVVNLGLIKTIGLYAASISTLVGYFVTMIYRIIDTRKYLKIKYDIKQFIIIGISTAVCCFVYYLNNKIISLIFLPIFIVFAYLYNKETVHSVAKMGINKIGKERFNKHKKCIILFCIIIAGACVGVTGFYVFNRLANKTESIQDVYTDSITEINPYQIIEFSQMGEKDFTCTGMTYDAIDNTYWIADYGAYTPKEDPEPRVVEVNSNFDSIIKSIDLSNILERNSNLQGLCYDESDDALWGAVGNKLVEFDKNGTIKNTIELGKYSKYQSNGVCYDRDDDSLWVLFASKLIIHYDKDGNILSKFEFDYVGQDHIAKQGDDLLITVGADYTGINNYVCRVSTKNGVVKNLYRVNGSNAVEGICINDKKVFIVNDGLYHSDLKNKSYISIYQEREFK